MRSGGPVEVGVWGGRGGDSDSVWNSEPNGGREEKVRLNIFRKNIF